MTSEDIVKGLEHCLGGDVDCEDCPYAIYPAMNCDEILKKDTLDLIKVHQTLLNRAIILPMPATEELKEELGKYCHERCVDEL